MSDGAGQDIPEESQTSDRESYHFVTLSRIKSLLPCLDQLYDELSIPPFLLVPSDIHSEPSHCKKNLYCLTTKITVLN